MRYKIKITILAIHKKEAFTQKEQEYIHNASASAQMVWRLWSMKESAYKIYTRQYGGRFFAPQKLNCDLFGETAGHVIINGISYQTITSTAKDYIYSIAGQDAFGKNDFYNCCFDLPQEDCASQQKFIHEKLITHYAEMKDGDKNDFEIIKCTNNIPFLYCKKEKMKIPVSITHHGNYAAFTIN